MKSRVPAIIVGLGIPQAAILLAFPIYNRIEPFVFGFSFNYFWIFAWLFLTSLCLFIAFRIDPYNNPEVMKTSAEDLAAAKEMLEKFEAQQAGKNGKGGNK